MKKQKLVKVLALFTMSAAAISCVAVIGCTKPGSDPHNHTYADEYSYDESGHWYAATCGHDDEKKDFAAHVYDGDDDDDCNICGYIRHDFESAWHYDVDGHWHECTFDGCEEIDYSAHNFNEQGICVDCGAQFATYEFIPSELEVKTYSTAYTSGLFTVLADTTIRTRSRLDYKVYDWANGQGTSADEPYDTGFNATASVQYDGSAKGISVNAIAPGRLTIYVDNGTSGKTKTDLQSLLLTRPDGSTQTIYYYCGDMYAITIDCDTVGTYKITRGNATGVGTTDLYYAKFETVVDVTPVAAIKIIDGGKVNYIKGESFDSSRLQINVIHETTMLEEPLSLSAEGLEIDYSEFDGSKAGTYTIYVTYKVDGKTFNDEYEVSVFDVEAIQLGFNKIVSGGNTAAGNGQLVNQSVKQFYFKDEQLDLTGLTVKTITDNGNLTTIVTEGFEVTGFTAGQAGKQTVTVTWNDNPEIKATFDVYVVNYTASSITASQSITVSVNGSYGDSKVGVLENGAYQFKTIQQSLEFLNALSLDKNTHKIINLAPGTYTEKLEINIPNLAIYGDTSNPASTVIEWDALVGIADESGYVHVTDSSATLNIREKAVGFVIEGVTISNWYNSEAHFTEKFGPNYGEHRALAMLIQADKVVIDNCRLLGYQDTIEMFTGRQYILNTYICGRTDFIFGTNNTTYFYNCEIESIVSGGYVTAFKGFNKSPGDSDWVQYGAIFDECRFTAPASVVAAKDTSLGRTWGKYAAVAYVNCDFAGHICTVPYGTSGAKYFRYTAMSGAEPTDSTVKFVEYNNTGAGALDKSVAGMTYLTAEEAAKYSDLSIIFGTKNGKVTYADAWDGSKGVEITTVDYRFSDFYNATDSYGYHDIPAGGEEILGGLATITGTKWGHELGQSKDQAKFDAGCVIQFNVAGKVTVTTYGSTYGLPENIKIVYVNGVATVTIVATESSPLNNGCYITLIQLNTKEKPAHEHDYGEWTISAPSADGTGTAERVCQNCEEETPHVDRVTLPQLSETDYIITSGTGGNVTYTYKADETISFEAAPLAGLHVHSYGDWVITATLDSAGTATKTCTAGGDCDERSVTIDIPALTDSRYDITNNTATTEAKGTGTYTIEINGETITFEAETAKLEMAYIEENTTFNFRSTQTFTETISAGQCAAYGQLLINGNENGSFKSNNGDWYIIAGDATLELKIKAGTTVTVQIGFCQDCLSFAFDGTAVAEGTSALTKSEYAGNVQNYTFVASADGVLSISRTPTAEGTSYIGTIKVTV